MARYPLNLPVALKKEAEAWAAEQNVSLNQFIMWAVAEKVGALKQSTESKSPAQRDSLAGQVLPELKRGLAVLYGNRLKGVYLFGSFARGEQVGGSDMDVMIVLDHIDNYWDEIKRTSKVISTLSLNFKVSISRVFVNEGAWLAGETPLQQNVKSEA